MTAQALIVDDEVEICLLLTSMLRRLGFNAEYAHDVKSASKRIQQNNFKTVFVDLNLPDGNGFDLFPEIKNQDDNVKIIVISAYDNEKDRSLENGADYFISKPFSRDTVFKALESLEVSVNK